jgi:hypothetical protein
VFDPVGFLVDFGWSCDGLRGPAGELTDLPLTFRQKMIFLGL